QPADARLRLDAVAVGSALDDRVTVLRARALAAEHAIEPAAALWRDYLGRSPRPKGWQDVALGFAAALLNHPSAAHAEEAVRVAQSVVADGGRAAAEARALEEKALATLPLARRDALEAPAEVALAALGLAEAGQGRTALKLAEQALGALAATEGDTALRLRCDALVAKGKALGALKRHGEALEAFALAVDACRGGAREAQATFLAGRSAARGGQPAEARRRFAAVEQLFPGHALADDARVEGAGAALKLGDEAAFVRMLGPLADDYPDGDMVDQGLFALALELAERGDWAGAVAPLEAATKRKVRGRPYHAEGRPQYFLARAKLALGQESEGLAALEQVVKSFPVSYYMVLAWARLAERDAARAERLVAEAMAAEPTGAFVIPDDPSLHTPAFERAVELVRQGEGEAALAELTALGVRDKSAPPSLLWASAFLLARIEAPAEAHGVLRGTDKLWTEHYPAGVWRPVWELAYPRPFRSIVSAESARTGTPEALIYAIMREESAFQPRAVSSAGARGLMQLMSATAKSVARPLRLPWSDEALVRPEVNIALGSHLLASLMRRWPDDRLLAIPSYNAGPGAPKRWLAASPAADFDLFVERMPYEETRNYTKRVIGSLAAYSFLYGAGLGESLLAVPTKASPAAATASAAAAADDDAG
ncbi:MAG: transglycosylase SLT domain-containing protein, partial [Myxococcales bacterium]|nr:transglycosylase SLT domain-containing protein [Myxococcales bacterium]